MPVYAYPVAKPELRQTWHIGANDDRTRLAPTRFAVINLQHEPAAVCYCGGESQAGMQDLIHSGEREGVCCREKVSCKLPSSLYRLSRVFGERQEISWVWWLSCDSCLGVLRILRLRPCARCLAGGLGFRVFRV